MRLAKVQITEFQSVWDSNEFDVAEVTCLVGKNEAGKTAMLTALYRLNPIDEKDGVFDVTSDYPRREVEDYRIAVDEGDREPATVVRAVFHLDEKEHRQIVDAFGPGAVLDGKLTLSKGYSNKLEHAMAVSEEAALKYVAEQADLPATEKATLLGCPTAKEALAAVSEMESTAETTRLKDLFGGISKKGLGAFIYEQYLRALVPKFLYFSEYYMMTGAENIQALRDRIKRKDLRRSDHPMIGLIELARLKLEDILNVQRTAELNNKLEGAGNHLSGKVLKYWSQNRHVVMRFDVREAKPGDPGELASGVNLWAYIHDTRHLATTELGRRSHGFVWFFSFLAWYSQIQRQRQNVVLLLDEPGLSLHGKAQGDLLRYFEAELKPHHQVLYTTHSPFLVDPQHFERVRIVEDKGIDSKEVLPREQDGTKVLTEALEAGPDSLFPLQGALGYELTQTLFVGPNSLIVEGVSDLLYLQTISGVLSSKGGTALDERWTITPVGGAEKVPTFVALLGAQQGLKLAAFVDFQKENAQTIENLYKRKLLQKNHVLTFADFTTAAEADIEDMFDPEFYCHLASAEFAKELSAPIALADLPKTSPRILVRLERYLAVRPLKGMARFNHYRPARYLAENVGSLAPQLSADTLLRFENAFQLLNGLL